MMYLQSLPYFAASGGLIFAICLVIAAVIFVVVVLLLRKKKPAPAPSTAPDEAIFTQRIFSSLDSPDKEQLLNGKQRVIVFNGNQWVETEKGSSFSLNAFLQKKGLNLKDPAFRSYHFYILNEIPMNRVSISLPNPLPVSDPKYGVLVKAGIRGRISTEIKDMEQLFAAFRLFRGSCTVKEFMADLKRLIYITLSQAVLEFLLEKDISILNLEYYLDDLDVFVSQKIRAILDPMGMAFQKMDIQEIEIVDDETLTKLQTVILEANRHSLLGYTYLDDRKRELMTRINYKKEVAVDQEKLVDKKLDDPFSK